MSVSEAPAAKRRQGPVETRRHVRPGPSSTEIAFSTARRSPWLRGAVATPSQSPAMMASAVAQQATELASGPIRSKLKDSGKQPVSGTRPWLDL